MITLNLPPLRERQGDIPILVEHLLDRASARLASRNCPSHRKLSRCWGGMRFRATFGNCENVMERMTVLCDGERIQLKDVPAEMRGAARGGGIPAEADGSSVDYKEAKDRFERDYLLRMIDAAKGNISEAARLSGISRRHLYEKMERLGIRAEMNRRNDAAAQFVAGAVGLVSAAIPKSSLVSPATGLGAGGAVGFSPAAA